MRRLARSLFTCSVGASLLASVTAQQPPARSDLLPPDAEIRSLLAARVDALANDSDGIGIVVGVVDRDAQRVIAYGHRSARDRRLLDGTTPFEIGSVGKTFTALLLADMVRRGEVALDDRVDRYLPDMRVPSRGGRSITLADLATHTSSLPFMPDRPRDGRGEAGSAYTVADLRRFVANYELPRDIASAWDYSNVGYWLLGEALSARARMDFPALLRTRVIAPLHLMNTGFILSAEMRKNLAIGHDAATQPAAPLSSVPMYSIMPAAGAGLFSTADDLTTLLSVAMGYTRSPLAPALAATLATYRAIGRDDEEQALGWTIVGKGSDRLVVHDGGTLGYASSVAWDPAKRVGVVVLSNHVAGVGDISRHLLRPAFPLEHPQATRRTAIRLDPAVLDAYAGRYEAAGEGVFAIVRDGDHLKIESPDAWGLPPLAIRPETTRDFFAAELPLRVTFQSDEQGHVTGLLVYPPRGQAAVPARRIGMP